jgi:hypothetical protein
MTTIAITTFFGRWDEAAHQLKRAGLTLTVENTIEVENKAISAILFELWSLAAGNVVAGFTIVAEKIQA